MSLEPEKPTTRRASFAPRAYAALLFVFALLPRVLYPVSRPLHWYSWSLHFISAVLRGDWPATYMKEHPGVFPMWLAGVGLAIQRVARGESLIYLEPKKVLQAAVTPQEIAAAVAPLALVIALEIVLVYFLLRRLTRNQAVAVIGSAWLALDPFHIANSKTLLLDATLSTTMFVSALFGLCYALRGQKWRDLILSGVFGGLAVLTKMPGVQLVLWTGLVLLAGWWMERRPSRSAGFFSAVALPTLVWSVVAALVFVALWPSMWVRPRLTLEAMFHAASNYAGVPHNHPNYFLGQVVTTDQGPWFYPVTCLVKSTFLTLPFLGIALMLLPLAWRERRKQAVVVLALVCYALLYTVQMTLGAKKGIRYILPVFPVIDVVAAFGVVWWSERLRQFQVRWLVTAVMVGAVMGQALVALPHHPYYDVRDNLLIGGHRTGRRLIAPMEQGEGLDLAARYLNGLPGASELRVGAQIAEAFQRHFDGETSEFTDPSADYLVFAQNTVTRQSGIEEWQTLWDTHKFTSPDHQVDYGGFPYVWVYQTAVARPLMIADIGNPAEANLGGVVDYLGYDAFSAHDISPGGVIELRLIWRARENILANYSVFVHLLDRDGQLVVQQDNWPVRGTRPTVTWTPGEVIADFYSLPIPLQAAPGQYTVYAGLYDTSTGERLPVTVGGAEQADGRLMVCTVTVQPLVPAWVWLFDSVWLGALLAGLLLPRVGKRDSEVKTGA